MEYLQGKWHISENCFNKLQKKVGWSVNETKIGKLLYCFDTGVVGK